MRKRVGSALPILVLAAFVWASASAATGEQGPADLPAKAASAAQTFADVPPTHPYYAEIEWLYQNGYTAGCAVDPLRYCPDATMNRAESATFMERGIHSASYDPPTPSSQVFADLPLDSWAAKWVNGLWQDQYTAGCGTNPLIYCPWQGHTRAEGTVFYLRMMHGADYLPPEPAQQTFADVHLGAWYARWVQGAYEAGLITACQSMPELSFCPEDPLSRGLAAYMMVRAKSVPGRIFYVSPSGSDSNPGTLQQPWKTIQKAVNSVSTGDKVLVREGTYTGQIIIAKAGITVTAYPGETVVIDGQNTTGTRDGYLTVERGADRVTVNGLIIRNIVGSSGIAGYGIANFGSNNSFANNRIINTHGAGIWQRDGTNNTFSSNELFHTVTKNATSVSDAVIVCNKSASITGWPSAINTWGTSANNIWNGNYVHDNCGEGIVPSTGDIIIGNTFEDNWSVNIYVVTNNITVQGNFIYETETSYIPRGSDNSWRALAAGLAIGDEVTPCRSHDIVFRNNIVVNTRYGFSFYQYVSCSGIINVSLINNTFVHSWEYGLRILNGAHSGNVIANNIIYPYQGKALIMDNPSGFSVRNNLWYTPEGNASGQFEWNGTTYSFVQWSQLSSAIQNNLWNDPKAAGNPMAFDAHALMLLPDSPAIDTGIAVGADRDYFGTFRPQGAGYDIGAHEYTQTPASLSPTAPPG